MTYFLVEKSFVINQVVYKQDEPSDYIYIIKEGEFEATRIRKSQILRHSGEG
jgi:CRP-like cAMP-binding protein